MNKRSTGLYDKYRVTRNDWKDEKGEKHEGCQYFVLDLTHDRYAIPALLAYEQACRGEYPVLAADLREMVREAEARIVLKVSSLVVKQAKPETTLTDGKPVTVDHREINPATGMQKGYVVLSESERAKGFVRPVRRSYVHEACGGSTIMGQSLAETYARQPDFYSGTYCATCQSHYPVGANGEFVWQGTDEKVGT